jgi:hypothetical protein
VESHIIAQDQEIQKCASAGRVMLTQFWDVTGPIIKHCQDCGQMVNSAWYCVILERELSPTIYSKCRRMMASGVVLHHDKALPHMAEVAIEII